ncbi:reverse transcriptase domain protein [Lasallia pustulata]|uniref:Reverse transcriptase domain protein n=1 Tax=Lasallia pustulata TaxID=136370 RepID=A0A1W5CUZ5_9LECA|nr:reverse transcriptase domain protein [Lasallia pustulata]
MSLEELKVLRKWLDDNLAKGFIRTSSLLAALPVLFAQKPGGGLYFCVDYRGLNAITIKNRYAMPLIQETLSQLSNAKYYTKLDIIAAFNTIRIKEGQEWLIPFNTHYGLFEILIMPFGLSNAPATFQARINNILRLYLDIFCTTYIDDILIYSNDLQSHCSYVYAVLQALREAGLHCNLKKCEFEVTEVVYLGMILSTSGVQMDPKKVKCIVDWQTPSKLKDVQAFLGFSNFYRQFIKSFSQIAKPLVALINKDAKFQWTDNCSQAFEYLKNSFIITPILKHYNLKKQTIIEADASDYLSSGILSQYDN